MKIDPYNHQEKYFSWKEKNKDKINGVSEINSRIILNYIIDMEYGLNVGKSSKKGARSYIRLNNLKQRIIFLNLMTLTTHPYLRGVSASFSDEKQIAKICRFSDYLVAIFHNLSKNCT